MIWCLFFLILFIILLTFPIRLKGVVKFNMFGFRGEVFLTICHIKIIKVKIKVRNGYIYIYGKKRTKIEEISTENFNIIFMVNFIKQIYYRLDLKNLGAKGQIGYKNNAMITSMSASFVDIILKILGAKIKNNKNGAHIFIQTEAKYNEDCIKYKFDIEFYITLLDILCSLILSLFKSKGEVVKSEGNN